MQSVDCFSLSPNPVGQSQNKAVSEIMNQGIPTGQTIQGSELEAQYAIDDRFLILTTENCPYEEALHIHLLDRQFEILDYLELAQVYSPGILGKIHVSAENCLEFTFFGQERWRLTVLRSPKPGFFRWTRRVTRFPGWRFWARRYLDLELLDSGIGNLRIPSSGSFTTCA